MAFLVVVVVVHHSSSRFTLLWLMVAGAGEKYQEISELSRLDKKKTVSFNSCDGWSGELSTLHGCFRPIYVVKT